MLKSSKSNRTNRGFTIVELLVVIVVIGILASITIVSYTGITQRANTAAGQSAANSVAAKASAYLVDSPSVNWPVSYGSMVGAPATATYNLSGIDFTIASGNRTLTDFRTGLPTDAVDYSVCGTNAGAVPASYSAITVVNGARVGYWNYGGTPAAEVWTDLGVVSGSNITCFKVGIAEAAVAVAKAIYTNTAGTYPATAAAINAGITSGNNYAVLPTGVSMILVNPTTVNGTTAMKFECGSAVAATSPCNNTGGRITFWDYTIGTPAVATITYGTATNFWVPAT